MVNDYTLCTKKLNDFGYSYNPSKGAHRLKLKQYWYISANVHIVNVCNYVIVFL